MSERNEPGTYRLKKKPVFLAILIFIIFCAMLDQRPWSGFRTHEAAGTISYRENPWVLMQGDKVIDDHLVLPEYLELEQGKHYTMSTTITYDGENDELPYCFLHVDHLYMRVKLDGKVMMSYMPEDVKRWDLAKSPGFIYDTFQLPENCKGKKLEVEILPVFSTAVEYGLPEVIFADFTTRLYFASMRDMPHDLVIILCVLMGIMAIAFSTVTLKGSPYREGMNLGIFCLLFSLYLITECEVNAHFIGNPYYLFLLNYTVFSLLPISLLGLMRERLENDQRKICTWVIRAEFVLFGIEMILHFGGIYDMKEVIPVIHVICFAEAAMIAFFILRMKDRKRRQYLLVQFVPVFIGMLADGMIYWNHWEIGGNDATFTILGVTIFMMVELFRVWKYSVDIYTKSVRSNMYREMAFFDEMTGIANRRAYDKEIENIIRGEKTYQSLIVVSADMNHLKYVNDHFGHAEGDYLIRSAAQIISQAVGDRGPVFRIGGDEFSAFLYDTDLSEYDELLQQAKEKTVEFNAGSEFAMSIAVGHVQIFDQDILEAVRIADRNMYTMKARMKELEQ